MMKFLLALSLTITVLTSVAFRPLTCEERGRRIVVLEPVETGQPTKVCIPDLIEVTQAYD